MFKKAKYLIRLDDASSHSDLSKWDYFEKTFDVFNVKPIIAVIPDNQDKSIQFKSKNKFFWRWIKSMENKGWSIALHGHKHIYHKVDRKQNIFPFYPRSEFSGLGIKYQRKKIRESIQLFQKNSVVPKIWIAPGHCFDHNTLKALEHETNIRIISDGISLNPYFKDNFFFIPQQLWSFQNKNFGLWTICLHPDKMNYKEINIAIKQIKNFKKANKIISMQELHLTKTPPNLFDKFFSRFFWLKYNLKYIFRPLE